MNLDGNIEDMKKIYQELVEFLDNEDEEENLENLLISLDEKKSRGDGRTFIVVLHQDLKRLYENIQA